MFVKLIKILLLITSVVMITASVSGIPEAFLGEVTKSDYIPVLAVLGLLITVFLSTLRRRDPQIGAATLVFLCAWAIFSFSVFSPDPVYNTSFIFLYLVLIVSSALLNRHLAWVWVVSLFFIYKISVLLYNTSFDIVLFYSIISEKLLIRFPLVATLCMSGFLPWFFLRRTAVRHTVKREKAKTGGTKAAKSSGPEGIPSSSKSDNVVIEAITNDSSHKSLEELLSSIVYFVSRNFKAYSSMAYIYNPAKKVFRLNSFQSKSIYILQNAIIPAGRGVLGNLGSNKQIFMSGDISLYHSDMGYYSKPEPVNSILAAAIISQDGELLGCLVLDSKDKNAFRDQDKELLKRFTKIAAALITNVRMRVFQERAATTFQIFYEMSHKFTTALKKDDVFDILFEMVQRITNCSRTMIILLDEKKRKAVVHKVCGEGDEIPENFEFPINAGLYSFAIQKNRVLNIPDMQAYKNDKFFRFFAGEPTPDNLNSLLLLPITDDEKRCTGLVSLESKELNYFSAHIQKILATMVENASVAFTRALLYECMEKLATTDGLTGLNNHRNFQEILTRELERSRRYGHTLSLLLMDIDHFKNFNDTYGHPVGDLVLKEIAACIRNSVRINDIPARYGGEEFAVIIPETPEKGSLSIAERIRQSIEEHVVVSENHRLKVTISVGCAVFPFHGETQQQLIDNADKALYYSKENGRNRVTLCNKKVTLKSS
ncbi:sensor domain-containing diguanylate cyclase [Chitinispirillales bacterium ANBcel5]|uniref:diguanylate cyclase n=1 Tax=Cellulosispirillum alkaliphilum TaxID=3039283 RepID=UPI002A5116E4|nr:sensor domain-containing diguanylate cyclase [Chitinispirillales bacterium ANBcel5]